MDTIERECDRLQRREVFSSLCSTDATAIVMLLDVFDPVQTILDVPMRTNHRREFIGTLSASTTQVVTPLIALRRRRKLLWRLNLAPTLDTDQTLKATPSRVDCFGIVVSWRIPDRDDSTFDASVTLFAPLIAIAHWSLSNQALHRCIERRLILFQGDQIVIPAVDNCAECFFYSAM